MATDVYLARATIKWGGATQLETTWNLESMDGPQPSRDTIETTHLASFPTTAGRTYIPPLFYDPGELTLTGRCDPTQAATFDLMYTAGTKLPVTANIEIKFYNHAGAAVYRTWLYTNAFMTSFKWNGEFDGLLQGTMTFKLSGDCAIS